MEDKKKNIFQELHKQIEKGPLTKRVKKCPDFPRMVDIELTNACNLGCRMCPSGVGTTSRTRGYMDCLLLRKLVTELRAHQTPIRLIRWGEPMLHPAFFNLLRDCKEFGIPLHFNTNGLQFSPSNMTMLIVEEVDSIKVSMQGGDRDSYYKWRGVDFYNQLLNDVKEFVRLRGDRKKPFIHVGTTLADGESSACFKRDFGPVADMITIGKTLDLSQERIPNDCPEMWDKLSVDWDGKVTACCGDYDNFMTVGRFPEQSLEDIWLNSKQLKAYREEFLKGPLRAMPLCKRCARGV